MRFKRKNQRIDIKLSSSIREVNAAKRSFCIVRNVSRNGIFLTSKENLSVGMSVECIISFNNQSIMFTGKVRRVLEEQPDIRGYGIEIIEISKEKAIILEEFIEAGYLPELES